MASIRQSSTVQVRSAFTSLGGSCLENATYRGPSSTAPYGLDGGDRAAASAKVFDTQVDAGTD
jgi:hypothetical protein